MLHLAVRDNNLRVFQMDRRIFVFHRIRIKEDRIILFAHGNGELIHDAAVAAVEVVLGVLSDQRQIRHCEVCNAEQVREDNARQNFKGSGRGEAGSVRDVAPDDHIESRVDRMTFFCESPHYAERIIRPVVCLFVCQIVQGSLYDAEPVQIHGVKVYQTVVTLSCRAVCTHCKSAGKYVSAVIVRMFADQVDTAR